MYKSEHDCLGIVALAFLTCKGTTARLSPIGGQTRSAYIEPQENGNLLTGHSVRHDWLLFQSPQTYF